MTQTFRGSYGQRSGNPLMVVGSYFSSTEQQANRPFQGTSGRELREEFVQAGLNLDACFQTNVVNVAPGGNDIKELLFSNIEAKAAGIPKEGLFGLYPKPTLLEGLQELSRAIDCVRPKAIIALGNLPLWALTKGTAGTIIAKEGYKQPSGITAWHGSMLRESATNIPVLPVYEPSYILRAWEDRARNIPTLARRLKQLNTWDEPPMNFIFPEKYDEDNYNKLMLHLVQLYYHLNNAQKPIIITADIETRNSMVECIGIGWTATDAVCIPLYDILTESRSCWTVTQETQLMYYVRAILSHPNAQVCGQNFLFDIQYLRYYFGLNVNLQHDTMIARHVIYPGTPLGLDYLSSVYCEHHVYWKADGKEAAANDDKLKRWEYNCRDCVKTYEIITLALRQIASLNLQWQYVIQMQRVKQTTGAGHPNAAMMVRGVRADIARRTQETIAHIEVYENTIYKLEAIVPESCRPEKSKTSKSPWYSSPSQLADLFYRVLGCKKMYNKKTGEVTTDDAALSKIGKRYPELSPLTETLSQLRSLAVFGNFLRMRLGPDERIRCTYSPTTETFRYRSSADVFGYGTNLQNIPKGNEEED